MKTPENSESGLMTLNEGAEFASVSISTLKRQHRKRRLKFVRFGHRTVRIRKAELIRFLATLEK